MLLDSAHLKQLTNLIIPYDNETFQNPDIIVESGSIKSQIILKN